ncbi:endonuclease [Streptomyces sp. P38-E01]|uniref:Endonuclease n=1 Tax=Streptomyces tardus TaxID=2780544 RepID=A0A949N3W7_9ACTN|nr:endonuclease [Streptomyces tardus]
MTPACRRTDRTRPHSSSVVLFYSGESSSKDNNGGDQGNWNREHVWAKSHGDFGTSPGPGTDIHHLRPTDVQVNSIRGNKDFDNGDEPVEGAPGNSTDNDSWEADDEVKGDVARMIFYMATRYEGTDSHPDLELNDQVENGSAPLHGKLSVLKEWHEADPPSDFEKNRNPFIDNPEWVGEIF